MSESDQNTIKCPNCEKSFDNDFAHCPHCGQSNKQLNLSFRYFIQDFISSAFNVDSKIFRTLKLLIFYPGRLSKAFLAGKRTLYIQPIRLYLIVSLIYFTLLSFTGGQLVTMKDPGNSPQLRDTITSQNAISQTDTITPSNEQVDQKSKEKPDRSSEGSTVITMRNMDEMNRLIIIEDDSVGSVPDTSDSKWSRFLSNRANKIRTEEGQRDFEESLRNYISIGMFILMPITALLFFILFHRGSYYLQHLVFVLHLQSAMYILFIVFILAGLIINSIFLDFLGMFMFLFLLIIWIKKFYEKSWGKTIWKTVLFLGMYGVSFGVFFIVVLLFSFWRM